MSLEHNFFQNGEHIFDVETYLNDFAIIFMSAAVFVIKSIWCLIVIVLSFHFAQE